MQRDKTQQRQERNGTKRTRPVREPYPIPRNRQVVAPSLSSASFTRMLTLAILTNASRTSGAIFGDDISRCRSLIACSSSSFFRFSDLRSVCTFINVSFVNCSVPEAKGTSVRRSPHLVFRWPRKPSPLRAPPPLEPVPLWQWPVRPGGS